MRKVVNITSIAGIDGNPGQAGYSSGKGRRHRSDKKLWRRSGDATNVNVNAVGFGLVSDAGWCRTSTLPAQAWKCTATTSVLAYKPSLLGIGEDRLPLGRLGTPEEAAGASSFFCSPLSDYVTGEVLICGGGLHSSGGSLFAARWCGS